MIKIVVKTEPMEIKARFFSRFTPNLKSNDVENKIIKITKMYRPVSSSEILSESTSWMIVFWMITSRITMAATVIIKINDSNNGNVDGNNGN